MLEQKRSSHVKAGVVPQTRKRGAKFVTSVAHSSSDQTWCFGLCVLSLILHNEGNCVYCPALKFRVAVKSGVHKAEAPRDAVEPIVLETSWGF